MNFSYLENIKYFKILTKGLFLGQTGDGSVGLDFGGSGISLNLGGGTYTNGSLDVNFEIVIDDASFASGTPTMIIQTDGGYIGTQLDKTFGNYFLLGHLRQNGLRLALKFQLHDPLRLQQLIQVA